MLLPGATLVSRSPELFFALDGTGGIEARPMKGTAPRDADPARDAALRAELGRDVKNRAENLMIVDLLRNDIGRIAEIGSVRVPELFTVETYATVHQMVSRVTGRLAPGTRLSRVFSGALSLRLGHRGAEAQGDGDHPRARALAARGLLRGDRLGGAGRAGLVQRGDPHDRAPSGRRGGLNVGGGVVAELERGVGVRGGLVESALRGSAPADLKLIETLRWEPGAGFVRLDAHLARLAAEAAVLGIAAGRAAIERALAAVGGAEVLRVRLTLALDGRVEVAAAPLGPARPAWTVVAGGRRGSTRAIRGWRSSRPSGGATTRRGRALPPGVDEAVFLNERGEVCEGTITNVFVDVGAGLVTPPLACGLLPGVLRAELLGRGECREAVLRAADLGRGPIFVGNSLRGLIPARLEA